MVQVSKDLVERWIKAEDMSPLNSPCGVRGILLFQTKLILSY